MSAVESLLLARKSVIEHTVHFYTSLCTCEGSHRVPGYRVPGIVKEEMMLPHTVKLLDSFRLLTRQSPANQTKSC